LLVYIDENFPLFISSKDKIVVQKRQLLCIWRRQDDFSGLWFSVWTYTELTPPICRRPSEPDSPTPSVWSS